jgi:hypothetical protein
MRPNCELAVFINGPLALAGERGYSRHYPRPLWRTGDMSYSTSSVSRWNPLLLLCQRGDPYSREF